MGNNKPLYEPGSEQSANGYDPVHNPANWHDSMVDQRPKTFNGKRFIALLSLDVISLFLLFDLVGNLSDIKEVVALFVGIVYLVVRLVILLYKFIIFIGKNSDWFKKGVRAIKEIFSE